MAEVIEETRRLKRALCSREAGLTPDEVFAGDFLDREHLYRLKEKLAQTMKSGLQPLAEPLIDEIERLGSLLALPLVKPTEEDLCRRFSTGRIDARTVIHITGWSVDELYDACGRFGVVPTLEGH